MLVLDEPKFELFEGNCDYSWTQYEIESIKKENDGQKLDEGIEE